MRERFGLPSGYNFDWVTNALSQPFRPSQFYAQAAQFGGVEAYFQHILGGGQLILAEDGNLFVSLAKTVASGVLGDAISLVDAGALGFVDQLFGLRIGTSGALQAIAAQLDQVLTELGGLVPVLQTSSMS